MKSRTHDLDHRDWQTLVGRWTVDASHPMLPGEKIRVEMTFECLDGDRLLIQRSRYDHPEIPDAIAIFGVIDDQLSMHYFDSRGVHRIFTVSFIDATLRYARNSPASHNGSRSRSATMPTRSPVVGSCHVTGLTGKTI